ncbi:MAG: TlpA family protein disulfide reductase [Saprospiraceae bacterium]
MKKIVFSLFLLATLLSAVSSSGQPGLYIISGHAPPSKDSKRVTLYVFDPISQEKSLTAMAAANADGSFRLGYPFKGPELYAIKLPGGEQVMLAIDEGQKNVVLNVGENGDSIEISGSPDSEKLLGYDRFRVESNRRLVRPTYAAMKSAGDAGGKLAEIEAVAAYARASEQHRRELLDYTAEHIGTSIALYGTVLRWTGDDEVTRLEKLVNDFAAAHPDLKMTQVMLGKVARFKKVAIGAPAPPIVEAGKNGSSLSLYDAKGKVTLIDFWASWCGPCLHQIPGLKEAYAAYHDKGFEIFGVSVDSKKDRWTGAIEKYGMVWPNVSDLKGWGSKVAADYNVTFVPFNMLIDADGTIIAKNLHGKALQSKLAELLDK